MEKPQPNLEDVRLSESKHILLERYLRRQTGRKPDAELAIRARPIGEPIPLSFAQQQVWLHAQMARDIPIYNEPITIYRHGALDCRALERCMVEILRRHEIWRTCFDVIGGDPVQIVRPAPDRFPLEIIDLRHLDPSERDAQARWLATESAQKPFDLKNGPLLRAILVRLDVEEYRLYMTLHQLVFDAVSAYRVFLHELIALYEAFSEGRPSPLPEPRLQYGDFAYWEQNTFADEGWSKELLFWREKLSGKLPALSWPACRPRPIHETHRGNVARFGFDQEIVSALRGFCRRQGVSLYMALLASFAALLHRYTAQDDIVIGGVSAGRRWPEIVGLLGDFINPFALRIDLSGNPTFHELTKRVMGVVLDALANEQVPLQKVVESLQLHCDPSRNAIFQVILSQQPRLPSAFQGWNLTTEEVSNGGSKLDLMIVIDERPDEILIPITYNTDLFDAPTVSRLFQHWQNLLMGGLANPDGRISELRLLTDGEWKQLLFDCYSTKVDFPQDTQLPALFETQAAKTPDAVAAEFEGSRLSYRQLNERANQLAHYLRRMGIGPEILVGVCMERSLEVLIALLGILKAGGAYVPLDPSFPKDRLAYMVEDSGMFLLITHRDADMNLSVKPKLVVRLDRDWRHIAEHNANNCNLPNVSPQNLAYVLYTSGSTGKPKGVEIEHGALSNFMRSMQREPGFNATDVLLAVSSLSFDISGLELYLPIVSGGKVVIASREDARDPVRLMTRMRDCHCNVMQATPATWQALIDVGWCGSPNLRVFCGGESLSRALAQQLLTRCGELWNMYGPTETTIWSAIHRVASAEGPIPCGRPIANTQFFVLDGHGNPVPSNVAGELYIGGAGLARGYLHRPELTLERFVASTFEPDLRLYRTGDLSRWLPDGTIECLGRVDNQVKIRGFRIELGEIEAALSRHKAVSQCAVIARERTANDKVLVAYVESKPGCVPNINELRTRLKRELPDYMVPSTIVVTEKLPLTPNGKIDRKALPDPPQGIEGQTESVPPQDPIERALARIWAKILKVKKVGRNEGFFELGGHSLAAVRMLAEVHKLTGKMLPLATLFEASTVEALAGVIRREGWTPSWSSLVPIQPLGSKTPLFLVHGAEGNVLLYRNLARHLGPDQPVYGLQSQGLNGDGRVNSTIQEMAAQYLKDVVATQPYGPYLVGGYCLGGVIALEMAQQLSSAGEKVDLVVMLDTYNTSATSHSGSFLTLPVHFVQNLWFHLANIASLRWKDQADFLREKVDVGLNRLRIRLNAGSHFLRRAAGQNTRQTYPHLLIKKVNDEAALRYVPQPYLGRVAVIRPKGHFLGLADASLGWSKVVRDGLEVHELPIYPKGMLVEPFCRRLAETLNLCLQKE